MSDRNALSKWRLWVFATCLLLPVSVTAAASPESHFFTSSDGVRLHYFLAGKGRPLVFIPGWSMPASIWHGQLAHFADRFQVVSFDPRSQGLSAIAPSGHDVTRRARDIHELLEHLRAESVVLVGWSLGVLESLAYLDKFDTGRVQALVLIDNSIGEDPPPSFDPTFLPRLRKDRRATVDRFVRHMFKKPQPEDYLRDLTEAALKIPLDASLALLRYRQPRDYWRDTVRGVSVPVLYVVTPRYQEQAENLKRARADVWIEVFKDAGHALFVDEAERFNELLARFLIHAGPGSVKTQDEK